MDYLSKGGFPMTFDPLAIENSYSKIDFNDEVNLSSNENLFLPLSALNVCVRNILPNFDPRKYPYNEPMMLKRELEKRYSLDCNNILFGNGSDQLIDLIIRSFLSSGGLVFSLENTFSMYKFYSNINRIPYKVIKLDRNFNFSIEDILKTNSIKKRKIFFLCSPNNPTGNQFDQALIEEIAQSFEGLLVIDEAYIDFTEKTSLDLVKKYSNVIILRTFSKSFGLAGLRIGYMIAQSKIVEKLENQYQSPYPITNFSFKIALEILKKESMIENSIKALKRDRTYLIDKLSSIPEIQVFQSSANFVLINCKGKNSQLIFKELFHKGIIVKDIGKVGCYNDCIRVAIPPREICDLFLNKFKEVLK